MDDLNDVEVRPQAEAYCSIKIGEGASACAIPEMTMDEAWDKFAQRFVASSLD